MKFTFEIKENKIGDRGWGCGYVNIPKNSYAYKIASVDSEDEPYYSFYRSEFNQQITFCEFNDDGLKIGFDTANSWNNETHDEKYVLNEAKKLCQICEDISLSDWIKFRDQKIAELTGKIQALLIS